MPVTVYNKPAMLKQTLSSRYRLLRSFTTSTTRIITMSYLTCASDVHRVLGKTTVSCCKLLSGFPRASLPLFSPPCHNICYLLSNSFPYSLKRKERDSKMFCPSDTAESDFLKRAELESSTDVSMRIAGFR